MSGPAQDAATNRALDGAWNISPDAISAGATLASAILAALGIWFVWRQLRALSQQSRSQIFLDLADRWTAIYPARIQVLGMKATSVEALIAKYPDYRQLFAEEFWPKMRELLNFFEVVGLMIHQKFITAPEVFVLVSVDREGDMNAVLQPYINFLRLTYRDDIYKFYDEYLLPEYHKRVPLVP
ncbi:MAG TPA: hypothetical protein VN231_10845 [Allosphingosinicella sp.]|nr:hypothetical protein [Allosphingosinicella sp.]